MISRRSILAMFGGAAVTPLLPELPATMIAPVVDHAALYFSDVTLSTYSFQTLTLWGEKQLTGLGGPTDE